MIVCGTLLGVREFARTDSEGKAFTNTVAYVLDGLTVEQVTLSPSLLAAAPLPQDGEVVAFEVGVRAYAGRNGVAYSVTGFARNEVVESALLSADAHALTA